jgi:hypothetical protein
MFGNIIFGGGIGALVDHNSGAAYEYPSLIQILMGKTTRVEPPKMETASVPASTPMATMQYTATTAR